MPHLNQLKQPRLIVSALLVVLSLVLSGVAFYYFQATTPLLPLLIGLSGAIPLGLIIDELRRLFKLPKTQQPHHPPKRS